jgi:hypothetical protein
VTSNTIKVTFDLEACLTVLGDLFASYENEKPVISVLQALEDMANLSNAHLPDVCEKPWSTFRRHRVGLHVAAPILKKSCKELGVEVLKWGELVVTLSDALWDDDDYTVSLEKWLGSWQGRLPVGPAGEDLGRQMLTDVHKEVVDAIHGLGPYRPAHAV